MIIYPSLSVRQYVYLLIHLPFGLLSVCCNVYLLIHLPVGLLSVCEYV